MRTGGPERAVGPAGAQRPSGPWSKLRTLGYKMWPLAAGRGHGVLFRRSGSGESGTRTEGRGRRVGVGGAGRLRKRGRRGEPPTGPARTQRGARRPAEEEEGRAWAGRRGVAAPRRNLALSGPREPGRGKQRRASGEHHAHGPRSPGWERPWPRRSRLAVPGGAAAARAGLAGGDAGLGGRGARAPGARGRRLQGAGSAWQRRAAPRPRGSGPGPWDASPDLGLMVIG